MIDVTLLGSAATMPTPERGVSAAVLRCGGRCILFDCGEGTQTALRREKYSPLKIDLIALSHYHGDHIFGLPGLLQTMSCLRRTEPLYITGPEGLEEALAPVLRLAAVEDYEIRLFPLPRDGICMRSLCPSWPLGARCAAVPTQHRVPSQGYLFSLDRPPKFDPETAKALGIPVRCWKKIAAQPEEPVEWDDRVLYHEGKPVLGSMLMGEARKGLKLLFSGDTQPCPALEQAAAGVDLLIFDATYGEDSQEDQALLYGHSTFHQAAELANRAKVKRLWLTHFSQMMRRPEDWLSKAQAVFPSALCGYDGLSLTLRFEEDPDNQ